ncbi:hypothetical protein [Haloarchaeobius sp. DFWS5]|uniref:hypothetical protein n=1 Tax=Haloarchaeobius sp. DFWS5 TaxID=3446114 RepID=UPI003EB8467D
MAVDEFQRASDFDAHPAPAHPENDYRDPAGIQTLTTGYEVAVEYHSNSGNVVTEYGTVADLNETTMGARPLSSVEVDLELRPVRIMWDGVVSELPETDDGIETELGRWATVRRVETDGGKKLTSGILASEAGHRSKGTKHERHPCPHCGEEFGNMPNHLPCDGAGGDDQ